MRAREIESVIKRVIERASQIMSVSVSLSGSAREREGVSVSAQQVEIKKNINQLNGSSPFNWRIRLLRVIVRPTEQPM